MFKNARIKLTAWYLLIIMIISISFSLVIYRGLMGEVHRFSRMQKLRFFIDATGQKAAEIEKLLDNLK